MAAASVAVAEAKILTTEIAMLAANKLCDLSGTRSTLAEHDLDRRWRDACTHTLHDPNYHTIGNFDMNCIAHQSPGLWTHPCDRSTDYKTIRYRRRARHLRCLWRQQPDGAARGDAGSGQ
jgi:hypothetical protein